MRTIKLQNETTSYKLETDDSTVYRVNDGTADQSFNCIDREGMLPDVQSFAVLNYIYVAAGQEAAFEKRFLGRSRHLSENKGFLAIRVLRPEQSSHYIIITWWEEEADFHAWQASTSYQKTHQKRATDKGLDHQNQVVDRTRSYHLGFQSKGGI